MNPKRTATERESRVGAGRWFVHVAQWLSQGQFFGTDGARYKHGIDIGPGSSGGCFTNGDWTNGWFCSAIVSSGWELNGVQWNEARAWDATTYNFFDTYGYWP